MKLKTSLYTYEGEVRNGLPNGYGIQTYNDGSAVYEGYFVDGKSTGKGKITWASGNVYEGDWIEDKRTGKGKYTWADGDVYEGDFVDDKRTGKGVLFLKNGIVVKSDYVDGRRTGIAKVIYPNGKEKVFSSIDNVFNLTVPIGYETRSVSIKDDSEYEYDCFISYKSQNLNMAREIYKYLVKSGKRVFFDKETLKKVGNSEYGEAIDEGLDNSKHFLLVISVNNIEQTKKGFVKREIGNFLDIIDSEGSTDRNVLILVDTVDNWIKEKKKLRVSLRNKETFDYSKKQTEFNRLLEYLK